MGGLNKHPQTSPWIWTANDYQDNVIRITVNFNETTRALQASSVFRDAACVYTKIYIGVGVDGTVASTPSVFTVPSGTTSLSSNQLKNAGFNTIEDILALQITAGP